MIQIGIESPVDTKYQLDELWNFYRKIHSEKTQCTDKCLAIRKYALKKEQRVFALKYLHRIDTASTEAEIKRISKSVDILYTVFINTLRRQIYSVTGVDCSEKQFVFR